MKKCNCPSCGAEVVFRSSLSVYAVCSYCNSMIVRRDIDVEAIGTMAALPDDMSPLQIGTGGSYNGRGFGIVGRLRMGWRQGAWNEWFLITDSAEKGWLAEAQGSYAVSFEIEDPPGSDAEAVLKRCVAAFQKGAGEDGEGGREGLGAYISLKEKQYRIVDVKEAVCIGSEGELPFTAPAGRKSLSIDLLGAGGEFGSIEIAEGTRRVYLGHYVEWDDMRCQNLRTLEGW